MGVDTKVNLLGYVKPDDIYQYILQNIDKDAKINVSRKTFGRIEDVNYVYDAYDKTGNINHITGFISFQYNGNPRNIFYHYENVNTHENIEYYSSVGLDEMVLSEKTSLILGCNDDAIHIMKEIVSYFGGWLDENDCDEDEYYFVKGKISLQNRFSEVIKIL